MVSGLDHTNLPALRQLRDLFDTKINQLQFATKSHSLPKSMLNQFANQPFPNQSSITPQHPTTQSSTYPTTQPSTYPTTQPSTYPTTQPSTYPTTNLPNSYQLNHQNNNSQNNNINSNNNIQGNNNNINNISISLNNFGTNDENLDMLYDESQESLEFGQKLLDTLGNFNDGNGINSLRKFERDAVKETFLMLFEEIYFNEKYPENHNIFVNDKSFYRKFHIFLNDRWSKIGNVNTLKEIIIRLKDIFLEWVRKNYYEPNINNPDYPETSRQWLEDYYQILKDDLNLLSQSMENRKITLKNTKTMLREFLEVAYKNRKVVEITFRQTKEKPIKTLKIPLNETLLSKSTANPVKLQ
jgi:hypothetical protein